MLDTSSARSRRGGESPAQSVDDKPVVIETRFGSLEFGPDNSIYMPVGPLGFSDFHHFGLADLPKPAAEHFKLLQCLDSQELGFIVTELPIDDGRVAREDLEDAALSVGIPVESALFLLIVTIRTLGESTSITANLRAPVVADRKRLIARQVVMANSSYAIQMPL